ncbi:MSHA pilin protein MshA [Rhodovulum sp. P5]|uniref:pre-peptidase C-terminal domain-containing protein n=1 Tax=Rhodovulum sp. P5 TaxID=1564506 RepID=UPI0009C1E7E9|nr:pre-peptidase C-terminal domain-containing protein [Rhodovulum sp. P5]ARE40618.1 MSHA pilin protein MshA [Rhodovulum sp. P5]
MSDDYGANAYYSGYVYPGSYATGSIDFYNDLDWFALDLQANHSYQVDLMGWSSSNGTLADPFISGLYSSDGSWLGFYDDDSGYGYDSQISFSSGADQRIYIEAGGYGTGTYTLFVTDLGGLDDYDDSTATTGEIAMNGSASGEIEQSNDRDWFRFSVVQGHSYRIDLVSASGDPLSDPFIHGIYDSYGYLFPGSTDDDGGDGLNSRIDFVASATENWYVSAGAYGSGTGNYTISITDLGMADDHGDNIQSAGSVSVGGSVSGEIDTGYDRDWFAVDLVAGQSYTISLEGSGTYGGSLDDPLIEGIYNASGSYISGTYNDDGGQGYNALVDFTPSASGTYYIAAAAYSTGTGTYTLSVTSNGQLDDYAADTGTTGVVSASGLATGTIDYEGDEDWFAISVNAGETYNISLLGSYSNGGTLADPYLRGVYDSYGNLLDGSSNDDSGIGLDSEVKLTFATGGTYYVSAGAYGSNTGSYTLILETQDAHDDYSDNTSTTGTVSVNGTVSGNIETAHDQDWFAVNLVAGEDYIIDLVGATGGGGTLADPYLRGIYTAAGELISDTENDDTGTVRDSQVKFTATVSGTHYIAAGAYSDEVGTYSLSVSQVSAASDDFAASTATTGSLVAGGSTTGVIETAGDTDWFAVTLSAGEVYEINVEGAETAGGTLSDPFLHGLYDASGTLLDGTENDDGGQGLNSRVTYEVAQTGTYYVAAGAFGSDTGTYKVSVTGSGTADDYAASTATTGQITVGGAQTGAIETGGDTDWFAVTLTAGTTYEIDLEGASTGEGTLNDPFFEGVYDSTGSLISDTSDDDGGEGRNSKLQFTAETSGTHYLSAGAYDDATGDYKLSIAALSDAPIEDDYSNDTATTGQVAVDGGVTGTIETTGDQDWFAVTLTAGETYQIDIVGAEANADTLSDPYLRGIYDSSGTAIPGMFNDDGGDGSNSRLEFTPDTSGTYYISAGAVGSNTGTYRLSVSQLSDSPSEPGEFDIVIDFSGDEAYRQYFEIAEARWEEVIIGDIPDITSETLGFIDDLHITASVDEIDGEGGILAQAGPRSVRSDSYLPVAGIMQFDSADLQGMVEKGILTEVITHEMGHVLGFGVLWEWFGISADFQYTGANALAAYSAMTGQSETYVPVENDGGQGTAGSHWEEDLFDIELMTGYSENSPGMPLSTITIGSLEDLGYEVDYGAADAFSLGGEFDTSGTVAGLTSIPIALSSSVAPTTGGDIFINYDDKAINVGPSTNAVKLDGTVTYADEFLVTFFETITGNRLFVELEGTFVKDSPQTAADVKGTLTKLSFYDEATLLAVYDFTNAPLDVEAALEQWRGLDLDLDNYIRNNSTTAQNDTIDAGAGDDEIAGGLGEDRMTGGAGSDTFFTMSAGGLLGDTITDFSAEDRIEFRDVDVEITSSDFSQDAAILYIDTDNDGTADGSITLEGNYTGQRFSLSEDGDTTTITLLEKPAASDFEGDGTSDILWRKGSGHLGYWQMNDGHQTYHAMGWAGTDWSVEGKGDLNGDGTSDILWRKSAGHVGYFEMDNGNHTYHAIGWAGTDWTVKGIGDLNGDGTDDILWRKSAGHVGYFEMDNGNHTYHAIGWAGTDWSVEGIGDLNGDGTDDILWRKAAGHVGYFEMHDGQETYHAIGWAGLDWSVQGIGDLNGDGTDDILWRKDSGHVGYFEMHDGQETYHAIGWAGTDWSVEGIGDLNGDGTDDVIWRKDTGRVSYWEMNDGDATYHVIADVGLDWDIV